MLEARLGACALVRDVSRKRRLLPPRAPARIAVHVSRNREQVAAHRGLPDPAPGDPGPHKCLRRDVVGWRRVAAEVVGEAAGLGSVSFVERVEVQHAYGHSAYAETVDWLQAGRGCRGRGAAGDSDPS